MRSDSGTTWCNKLASTPSVGIRFDPSYIPSEQILRSHSPILDRATDGEKPLFSIEALTPFGLTFNTEEGYKYILDQSRITIQYNHRVRFKPITGGPPVMELLSRPMPFTELLSISIDKIIESNRLIKELRTRSITKIGIVSTTLVDLDEVPPGIKSLIDHLARPWDGKLSECNVRITTRLREDDRWSDVCHHHLIIPQDRTELTTIVLDWQRSYSKPHQSDDRGMRKLFDDGVKSALDYFEEVAEGVRFDESERV